jgi:hypothetical protein
MLKLSDLLRGESIDPDRVQLIRHKDARLKGRSLHDVWRSEPDLFDGYQAIQTKRNAFSVSGILCSFVVTDLGETLFLAAYDVVDRRPARPQDVDPLTGTHFKDDIIHTLQLSPALAEYRERVSIEVWRDPINYVKRMNKCDPKILSVSRHRIEEPFPGYMTFQREIADLDGVFDSWKCRLQEANGVYLLAFKDGAQYVGSATGKRGFWGRWEQYWKDGHGGNKLLQDRDARLAEVSILETSGSAATRQENLRREAVWKAKLGTRATALSAGESDHRLNAN